MRIRTVSVTYGRKLNLGNYNSANISLTLWADIDATEDPSEVTPRLQEGCRQFVRDEVMRLTKPQSPPTPQGTQDVPSV